MSYIFLAILSHFAWSLENIGDKYILTNRIKNPFIYVIFLLGFGVTAVMLIPFVDFQIPSWNIFWWQVAAAAFYYFGGFPYMLAMQREDASRINFLWGFVPLFSLVIGWLAIDETIGNWELAALGILIIASILSSLHIGKLKIRFSKAFFLMILASLCYAFYAVCMRRINMEIPFISAFIWHYLIMFVFSLIVVPTVSPLRRAFKEEVKALTTKTGGLVAGIAFLDYTGIFLNVWALSLGPVALVYAMEGFQMLFVFILVIILSLFFKINLKEELDRKNILLKIAALILMITGVVVLSYQQ